MSIDIQPADRAVFDRLKSTGRVTSSLRHLMTRQWNTCSICKKSINRNRPAFAGYGADSTPLYVGASCAGELTELATPVYWTDNLDLSADDNQLVWRYMDFAKFISLLQQNGLFIPRADSFEDRFEGAVGLSERQDAWDQFYLDFFRKIIMAPPLGHEPPKLSEAELGEQANKLLLDLKSMSSEVRSLLVSCWHANAGESEALWRLYCPPPTMGIAIQTTVGKLWDASADQGGIVGRVHYLDFRRAFATNGFERIFCKRASLSHENEIRLVLHNDDKQPARNVLLSCDLNLLINRVVVSPFAPSWFAETVEDVIKKYGYTFEMCRSELTSEPFY